MAKKKATEEKAPVKKPAAKKAAPKKATAKKAAPKKTAAKETAEEKPPAKKKRATRRSKEPVEVRLKATWGIFNQSVKEVASFEYFDRKAAEKKKDTLSKSGKSPHFIRLVKKPIEEEDVE